MDFFQTLFKIFSDFWWEWGGRTHGGREDQRMRKERSALTHACVKLAVNVYDSRKISLKKENLIAAIITSSFCLLLILFKIGFLCTSLSLSVV